MVGKRTLLTELINLINEIQFKLKNNHSFDWTPTPEINLAQVDPPVQLQALFCLMTHHWSIKQNNFYRITRTYFGVRSSGQRSAGTFPTCLPDGQKSQKIHRKAWDGRRDFKHSFPIWKACRERTRLSPLPTSHTKMITTIFRSDLYRFVRRNYWAYWQSGFPA